MIRNIFSPKILLVSALLILTVLPLARSNEAQHNVEKRQVGVLARTGALPQGKRSVEALARNGELPIHTNEKRDNNNNEYILDLLIQELAAAEGLSRLHLQALTERLLQEKEDEMEQENSFEDADKRSVSALARTGKFPQKRSMEAMARSGYLIKPASQDQQDLLDPDEFLGKNDDDMLDVDDGLNEGKRGGLAALAKHGYIGKREGTDDDGGIDDLDLYLRYLNDQDENLKDFDEKRHIGAARNFINDKRHLGSARNFIIGDGKRNLGSLRNFGKRNLGSARNFGGKRNIGAARNFMEDKRNLASFKNYLSGKRNVGSALRFMSQNDKRNVGAARNFFIDENKRNVGAARNFFLSGSKKNLGAARNFFYGKRNLASFARDGGFSSLKYPSSREYEWDDEFDFDDFHNDDKRYLGSFLRNQRYLGSVKGKRNLASFKNFGKRFDDEEGAALYYGDDQDEDIGEVINDDQAAIEKRQTKEKEEHVNGTVTKSEKTKEEVNKKRTKREAFIESPGEYPMPVFQNSKGTDYEDLMASLVDEESQNDVEKRFLGSVAPIDWSEDEDEDEDIDISKRHIGALARLGWLPSFRSTRYSRSGRAIDNRIVPFRENPPVGSCPSENSIPINHPSPPTIKTKLAITGKNNGDSLLEEPSKRYLLIPAVDNIIFRRLYPHRYVNYIYNSNSI